MCKATNVLQEAAKMCNLQIGEFHVCQACYITIIIQDQTEHNT